LPEQRIVFTQSYSYEMIFQKIVYQKFSTEKDKKNSPNQFFGKNIFDQTIYRPNTIFDVKWNFRPKNVKPENFRPKNFRKEKYSTIKFLTKKVIEQKNLSKNISTNKISTKQIFSRENFGSKYFLKKFVPVKSINDEQ